MEKSKPCRVPGCHRTCDSTQSGRGLCGPCYQNARRLVQSNETSWRELEDLGLTNPPIKKVKEKAPSLLETALEDLREDRNLAAK